MDKKIEVHRKYIVPTAQQLFDMFCAELFTFNILRPYASSIWTETVLTAFGNVGRKFGYTPNSEYLYLDQTWEIREPDVSTIVMALEHENTTKLSDLINDELLKLMDVKAYLKILFYYPEYPVIATPSGELSIPEIVNKICSAKFKNHEERYVIITGQRGTKDMEVAACSCDIEGHAEYLGSRTFNIVLKDTNG